jgi:hypothetical protein
MNAFEQLNEGATEMRQMQGLSINSDPVRIPVYIYRAQLRAIDEICRDRRKSRRLAFLEAFQTYIGLYKEGKV